MAYVSIELQVCICHDKFIWEILVVSGKTEAVEFTEFKSHSASNNVTKTSLLGSPLAVADCGVAPVESLTGKIKTYSCDACTKYF